MSNSQKAGLVRQNRLPGKNLNTVAAVVFCGVQGFVRFVKQGGRLEAGIARRSCNPEAARHAKHAFGSLKGRRGYGGPDLFGTHRRALQVASRQGNEEFLATISAGRVVTADAKAHSARSFLQHGVAGGMAQPVVNRLEM